MTAIAINELGHHPDLEGWRFDFIVTLSGARDWSFTIVAPYDLPEGDRKDWAISEFKKLLDAFVVAASVI